MKIVLQHVYKSAALSIMVCDSFLLQCLCQDHRQLQLDMPVACVLNFRIGKHIPIRNIQEEEVGVNHQGRLHHLLMTSR